MTHTITISKCDNELYLVACNSSGSYQLAHIQSGNRNAVNVVVTISPGSYVEPPTYNGVGGPLNESYGVSVPSGDYQLVAFGVDWGGVWYFSFTFQGQQPDSGENPTQHTGVVWVPPVQAFSV